MIEESTEINKNPYNQLKNVLKQITFQRSLSQILQYICRHKQKKSKRNKQRVKDQQYIIKRKYYLFERRENHLKTNRSLTKNLNRILQENNFKDLSYQRKKIRFSNQQEIKLGEKIFTCINTPHTLNIYNQLIYKAILQAYCRLFKIVESLTLYKPILNMEDETEYLKNYQDLKEYQYTKGVEDPNIFHDRGVSQQNQGLNLKKKYKFSFKVKSFECVGKYIVLGSEQGALYAYKMLQVEQKQQFKLLYTEQNAHPQSYISQIIHLDSNQKIRQSQFSYGQGQQQINSGYRVNQEYTNEDIVNNDREDCFQSQSDKQGINSSPKTTSRLTNLLNKNTQNQNKQNKNINYNQGFIISCGLYERKIILWQMANKFIKKAESLIFKTFIHQIAVNGNFIYAATRKKVYALNTTSLSICMKFGLPSYNTLDFLISSIICLPLNNSNILIVGTNCYKGHNYFISLWEHPKEYNLQQQNSEYASKQPNSLLQNQRSYCANGLNNEDDDINFNIDNGFEEENNQNYHSQLQQNQVLNDIEDLDNFDLDGDFVDENIERDQNTQYQHKLLELKNKQKRRSFWKPNLLEHCHNSHIKQLKCIKNNQQFISISLTEINIWKIVEGNQIQAQQLNITSQLTQNISNNNYGSSTDIGLSQMETFSEKSLAQQVFSLQLNTERNINAIVEKYTNNIILFIDSEIFSFDSNSYKLNFQSNISSQSNQHSQLYLNKKAQKVNSITVIMNSNRDEISATQHVMHPHNNHYVLIQNNQTLNLNLQSISKFIAVSQFDQCKSKMSQNTTFTQKLADNSIIPLEIQNTNKQNIQQHYRKTSFQRIQESRFEEEEMRSPKSPNSPKISQRIKKFIQSPIMKPISFIPTSVPPVQKYSTAHIVPSTASYTILMNKLKQIEQSNIVSRQLASSGQPRRPNQSSTNINATTYAKPYTNYLKSNSKCIKKQLKRHVKYSNKKKKVNQNLVKVFGQQNTQLISNLQDQQINPQFLTLVQSAEHHPQQSDFSQKQQNVLAQNYTQNNIHQNNQSHNNNNKQNIIPKTVLIALDSDLSLGFYHIQ